MTNRFRALSLLAVSLLATLGATKTLSQAATQPADVEYLTFSGIGQIKLGASPRKLRDLGLNLVPNSVDDRSKPLESTDCANTNFFYKYRDKGLLWMGALFAGGRVRRVDIRSDGISTTAGIHVNSKKQDVRRAYGSRLEEFSAPANTLIINGAVADNHEPNFFVLRSPDKRKLMLIEMDGDLVVSLHVGLTDYFLSFPDAPVLQADCLTVLEGAGFGTLPHP